MKAIVAFLLIITYPLTLSAYMYDFDKSYIENHNDDPDTDNYMWDFNKSFIENSNDQERKELMTKMKKQIEKNHGY